MICAWMGKSRSHDEDCVIWRSMPLGRKMVQAGGRLCGMRYG